MTASIPWRQILLAVPLWFLGCSLLGMLIATVYGEFGSIVFVIIGIAIGSCGGISHAALLLLSRFRALPALQRYISVWFVSMTLFLALGVALSWSPRELLVISLSVAVPTMLVSIGVDLVLARRNAA